MFENEYKQIVKTNTVIYYLNQMCLKYPITKNNLVKACVIVNKT